jgi:hypothetical protein
MAFLTDRTLATGVTLNDLIHIVITGDTSQNPAGSSYKATISQVTDLVNSTVITGGTYNPITGEITFVNSSGGTFVVTGFVTGYTDTFVSGGTYSAGTATFTNTSGGTFNVTGFTQPFSGGSGSCITDLYVTNIYGCSPITLQSELRTNTSTAIGILSFAQGQGTTATGNYSHSQGRTNNSIGNWSHAEGILTQSSGSYSHSEGSSSTASGDGSHAEGSGTTSSGQFSHSEGFGTLASNSYSHSEGSLTIASGNSSHAEGLSTQAIGSNSHSEGTTTIAIGTGSHSEGLNSIASGTSSHAEGRNSHSIGVGSHAEGGYRPSIGFFPTGFTSYSGGTTIGDGSHAEGVLTISTGIGSHAEGVGTNALGNHTHAEGGYFTGYSFGNVFFSGGTAIGLGSHAEGQETFSYGISSHVEGYGTITNGSYQHVQGQFNSTASTQSAFIIGNGIDDLNRSNLVLAANNEFNIYGDLNVTGNINGSISATTQFISTTGLTTSAFTITTGTTYWGINYNGNVDVSVPDPTGYDGLKIIIKDEGGYSGSYRIRLTPIAGTIDGNSYVDMNINYMSLTLVTRNNNWWII